ncbi:MAG: hypothetical protein AVDCRST_MAG42-2885, partial [uncultured Chthoniobacterales bacterium]
ARDRAKRRKRIFGKLSAAARPAHSSAGSSSHDRYCHPFAQPTIWRL